MAGLDLGSILGAAASAYGSYTSAQSVKATNAQNYLMNTGDWKGQQLLDEAAKTGLSPLALLGNTGSSIPMQPATMDLSSTGQMLGRAVQSVSPAEERLQALQEQKLALENANLHNDYIAGQMRNSVNRATYNAGTVPTRPASMAMPNISLDEVWGSVHPGTLAPKAGLQAILRPDGKVYYIPSATVQSGLWSPVPGLAANPQAASDVVRANAADMPPDVARMSGLPPGHIPIVEGTAPSFYDRYLRPETEGRDDPDIYGR